MDKFIRIKPRKARAKSSKRIKGVNFIFYKEIFRTPNIYFYLKIGIGYEVIEKLNLKNGMKVKVSYNPANKYILELKKTYKADKKAYTLTRSCKSKNAMLRTRIKWDIFKPPEKWFEKPQLAKYEIIDDSLVIKLK